MERVCLSNPAATREAQQLYDYIKSMHGVKILSGQQEGVAEGKSEVEFKYIKEVTGKQPAIRGLDYIHDDFAGVNQRAKAWWNQGGIVTICWHWGTPPNGIGYPSSQEELDFQEVLKEGTNLNKEMIARMDEVAMALKELQEGNIPVLWRPLHEFDGAWFWWGKGGAESFQKLWRLMYERFTKVHGLNHLIWVLGYCGEPKDGWYPGDDCVDVVGADFYSEGTKAKEYQRVKRFARAGIPVAYHECGPIPDPDQLMQEQVNWSWFMTWHTIHIKEQNKKEYLRKVYQHDYVVTLDQLPRYQSIKLAAGEEE